MQIWAEAGPCGGSVSEALKAADQVASAGADALKVQWFRPDMLVTPTAPRYDRTDHQGRETQYQEFSRHPSIWPYDRWHPVIERCAQHGIGFIPSVFDGDAVLDAVQMQRAEMGVSTLKIASGDITYRSLIEIAALHADTLVISTGASTMDEVVRAVGWARAVDPHVDLILLACHLEYPTEVKNARLGRLLALQGQFHEWSGVRVGYSDHTPGTATTGLLAAMGCAVQEKHFSLHPGKGGGDHDFAVGRQALARMVAAVGGVYQIIENVDLEPTLGEMAARTGARRSLYLRRGVESHVTAEDVIALRPYDPEGYEPWELMEIFTPPRPVRVQRPMKEGELLRRKWVGSVGGELSVE